MIACDFSFSTALQRCLCSFSTLRSSRLVKNKNSLALVLGVC